MKRSGSRPTPRAATNPAATLAQAFDAARFGAERTLDLRSAMPTADEARQRLEPWLRQKQVEQVGDVLVITGRGNGSPGGVGVVRETVRKALTQLKRRRVVASVQEHTAGAFVVTLERVAALFEAGPRYREPDFDVPALTLYDALGLERETSQLLRALAERALDALGVPRSEKFVKDEYRRQFSVLSAAIPPDVPDREAQLRTVIRAALETYDDGE